MKPAWPYVLWAAVAVVSCGVVGCDGGEGGRIYNAAGDLGKNGQVYLTLVQGTLRPGSGPWSFSRVRAWDAKGHAIGCMIESFDDSMDGSGITLSLPCTGAVDSIRLEATLLHEGKARRVETGWKATGSTPSEWELAYWRIDGKEIED